MSWKINYLDPEKLSTLTFDQILLVSEGGGQVNDLGQLIESYTVSKIM